MTQYTTHLDIKYPAGEKFDVQALVEACQDQWYNQTLCQVNDSVVRLGVLEGEYHWHQHDDEDEFFLVLDGSLLVDFDDRVVELGPRQAIAVPRGVRHRTRAPQRTVVIMLEGAAVVPTGD
jgi:mannose-6-phosphate isomerase-like protein (cupin superfamily)